MVSEVILMMFVPKPIQWLDPQEHYNHHPELIHVLKPNQNSFTQSAPVRTNSYGLRDYEFSLVPDQNTIRILCLGDSLTFGNGVEFQHTYPKQLESLLNHNAQGKHFEVINGGIPAYDTWQEVTYIKQYGWQFDPDLVIIGVYANDIAPKPKTIPKMVEESGARRRPGWKGFVPNRVVYFLKNSRLLLLLRDRFSKLMNRITPSPEYNRKLSLLLGTTHPFIERGWKQVELSLQEVTDLRNEHGFDLLLVVFPMADQLLQDYSDANYQSRLRQIALKYDIQFLDLMPAFAKVFNGFGSLFIEWDGHPNPRAYAIAAEDIARYLSNEGVLLRHE